MTKTLKDTGISDNNPFTIEQRKDMFKVALPQVKVITIPNIDEVCYGRTVGWGTREIKLDKETEAISATAIRKGENDEA